jgi:hypothetical protein
MRSCFGLRSLVLAVLVGRRTSLATDAPSVSEGYSNGGMRELTCEERYNRFVYTPNPPDLEVVGDPEGEDQEEEDLRMRVGSGSGSRGQYF